MIKTGIFTSSDMCEWKETLAALLGEDAPLHLMYDYVRLYSLGSGEPGLFFYIDGTSYFLMSMVINPIESFLESKYYDFETPYGYGGPVANSRDEQFQQKAWEKFRSEAGDRSIIAGFLRFDPCSENHLVNTPDYVKIWEECPVVVLDLNHSMQDIEKGYKSNARTNIRKAIKNGYKSYVDETGDLSVFKKIYHETMRRVSAKDSYFFGDEYFKLLETELSRNFDIIYIENQKGEKIAGGLILYSGETAIIHLSACRNEDLRYGVPSLVRHACIEQIKQTGAKQINMGGGTTSSQDDPLFKFKSSFSRERSGFYIGSCLIDPNVYKQVCDEWKERGGVSHQSYFLKYRL